MEKWFRMFIDNWLSLVLLVGVVAAVYYVYKNRDSLLIKFKK